MLLEHCGKGVFIAVLSTVFMVLLAKEYWIQSVDAGTYLNTKESVYDQQSVLKVEKYNSKIAGFFFLLIKLFLFQIFCCLWTCFSRFKMWLK